MKAKNFRDMTNEELETKLKSLKQEYKLKKLKYNGKNYWYRLRNN